MAPEHGSNRVVFVVSVDGVDSRIGSRFNELDEEFHRERVNGSITIHYSQGTRAKIHHNHVEG